jgi:hypothetical protein
MSNVLKSGKRATNNAPANNAPATHRRGSYRRHGLGIVALLCGIAAVYLHFEAADTSSAELAFSSCIRCGIVLFFAWLAYPQLEAIPAWLLTGLLGFGLLMALLPRLVPAVLRVGIFLLPVFVTLWVVRLKFRRPTR